MTVGELLDSCRAKLAAGGVENARQETEWMVQDVLGVDSAALFLRWSDSVVDELRSRLEGMVARRVGGAPFQYVLGHTDFFGLRLDVGPGVLVPRPETERLVELALESPVPPGDVCDLCTGSGAILFALAVNLPAKRHFVGVDISGDALAYAERNRQRLSLRNVTLQVGDLFSPLPVNQRFALITANPPYVSATAFAGLPADVRQHEPLAALLAKDEGLAVIRRIAAESPSRLVPGGYVLCEIGEDQGEQAAGLFRDAGFRYVHVAEDRCGKDRIVIASTVHRP